MSRVTEKPRTTRVQLDVPAGMEREVQALWLQVLGANRPAAASLEHAEAEIQSRAMTALASIEQSIVRNPTTGQARVLVEFLAGLYDGPSYPFDMTSLRALDTALANACLDYLNYDRLGETEVHTHLKGGARELLAWIRNYGIPRRV